MKSIEGKGFIVQERKYGELRLLTRQPVNYCDKPIGTYSTLLGDIDFGDKHGKIVQEVLEEQLYNFIEQSRILLKKTLTVGLGNGAVLVDSLGPRTCDRLTEIKSRVKTLKQSTFGLTGVVTADAVAEKARIIKPSHAIIVDSLSSIEPNRIHSFQVSDSGGLAPGSEIDKSELVRLIEQIIQGYHSGEIAEEEINEILTEVELNDISELITYLERLKKASKRVDSELLGTPVLSIGVPMILNPILLNQDYILQAIAGGGWGLQDIEDLSKFIVDERGHIVPKDPTLTSDAVSFYSENIAYAIDKIDKQSR